jgi:hypothetical protein
MAAMELISSEATPNGVVIARYRPTVAGVAAH